MTLFRSDRKMRDRSPDSEYDYDRQRREVKERDGIECQLERWVGKPTKDGPSLRRGSWVKCGRRSDHTVHVRRRQDCGRVPDHRDVAIRGCEACHVVLDNNWLGKRPFFVRVPPAAELRCYAIVKANSKRVVPEPFIPQAPTDILPPGEAS
jgi:hypothetical protein